MTSGTICSGQLHTRESIRRESISRTATWLHAVAGYVERRAQRRARAKAARMAARELNTLGSRALYDIGLTPGDVDAVVNGMLGPSEYWGPYSIGRDKRNELEYRRGRP